MAKVNEFKKLVEESGLKLKKIAELMQVSVPTIESDASGRRKAPPHRIEFMKALCEALKGVDYE